MYKNKNLYIYTFCCVQQQIPTKKNFFFHATKHQISLDEKKIMFLSKCKEIMKEFEEKQLSLSSIAPL